MEKHGEQLLSQPLLCYSMDIPFLDLLLPPASTSCNDVKQTEFQEFSGIGPGIPFYTGKLYSQQWL